MPLRGLLSPLREHQVRGWAFEPEAPDHHVTIEVRLDGQQIGRAQADLFYDHLAKAGIGQGDHGFTFNTDQQIPTDVPERLEVVAYSQAGQAVRLPLALRPPPAPFAAAPQAEAATVRPSLAFRFQSADATQHPVFVLGAARSGTSALAQALMRSTRYQGHGEGHLLDLVSGLLGTVGKHYADRRGEWVSGINTMIAAVPQRFMEDAVRHGFVELARSLFPSGFWLDKTPRPAMTRAAPCLLDIWPDARFVYMKRRAIENIESRRRKFPGIGFAEHCADWTANLADWHDVKMGLSGRAVEIDQQVLAHEPGRVVEVLAPLLSLNAQEGMRLKQALAFDHPERTSRQFGSVSGLDQVAWTPEERAVFRQTCGATMRQCGYADGPDYFLAGQEHVGIMPV